MTTTKATNVVDVATINGIVIIDIAIVIIILLLLLLVLLLLFRRLSPLAPIFV